MDIVEITKLIEAHKWLPLIALGINLIVRGLKSDVKVFPFNYLNVDSKYLAWIALGLGVVEGVVQSLIGGTPIVTAIIQGLIAGMTAIVTHETVIESARNGRDIGVKKGSDVAKASVRGYSLRGPVYGLGAFTATMIILCGIIHGCANFKPVARTVNDIALEACQLFAVEQAQKMGLSPAEVVKTVCEVDGALQPFIDELLAAKKMAAAKFAAKHPEFAGDAGK